jgi:hypothetical protein
MECSREALILMRKSFKVMQRCKRYIAKPRAQALGLERDQSKSAVSAVPWPFVSSFQDSILLSSIFPGLAPWALLFRAFGAVHS